MKILMLTHTLNDILFVKYNNSAPTYKKKLKLLCSALFLYKKIRAPHLRYR